MIIIITLHIKVDGIVWLVMLKLMLMASSFLKPDGPKNILISISSIYDFNYTFMQL